MQVLRALRIAAISAGLALSAPALAHAVLVSASPAASSTAPNVRVVRLTFNEAFMPKLSGLEIMMTGMPGMAHHGAMKMTGVAVTASADRKTLIATLARPLPAGSYDVNWHTVGSDTHRVTGKVSFTVK